MGWGNPIVGGIKLIRAAIQSPNFQHSVQGWTINQDGTSEFNNVTVRGTVIDSQSFTYYPSPGLGNLIASDSATPGTDQYGNAYLSGTTGYAQVSGFFYATRIGFQGAGNGAVVEWLYAASSAGPWIPLTTMNADASGFLNFSTALGGGIRFLNGANGAGKESWIFPSGDITGATDLTAINNELNINASVRLFPGIYYINNTISIPAGGSLTGPPSGFDTAPGDVDSTFPVVIKLTAAANTHMISIHGDNFYIGNLELDGRRSVQTANFGNGILVNGHKYGIIEGVSVHDCYFRGIMLTASGGTCEGIKILRSTVGANNDTGIYFDGTGTPVTDCLVWSTLVGQNGVHGIYDAGDVIHIDCCDIYANTQKGIMIANGAGHLITNCGIDRNLQDAIYVAAPDFSIVACTLHTNSQQGNGLYNSITVDNTGLGVYGGSIYACNFWLDPTYTNLPKYHVAYLGTVTTKAAGNGWQTGSYVTSPYNTASAAKDANET